MTSEEKREHEKKAVDLMIRIYCHGNHHTKGKSLCKDCEELTSYCNLRTDKCPFMETKTFCSACKVHCYSKENKEKIRKVMRYAGPRMLLYHPVLAIKHAVITLKQKQELKKQQDRSFIQNKSIRNGVKHVPQKTLKRI